MDNKYQTTRRMINRGENDLGVEGSNAREDGVKGQGFTDLRKDTFKEPNEIFMLSVFSLSLEREVNTRRK